MLLHDESSLWSNIQDLIGHILQLDPGPGYLYGKNMMHMMKNMSWVKQNDFKSEEASKSREYPRQILEKDLLIQFKSL